MLWLSTLMIHHANNVRPNPEKVEGRRTPGLVGLGRRRSSPRSISTSCARAIASRSSRTPRPIYHAAQYLLGHLDRKYLTTLREFKGLQAYPSRTKDPDPVDFSTGSVGLGAVAPVFAALAAQLRRAAFRRRDLEPLHLADRRRRAR